MVSKVATPIHSTVRRAALLLALLFPTVPARAADESGLLFYVSGEKGTTADFSAGGTPEPNFDFEVTRIPDGAKGAALQCGDLQRLSWWAPGNIYAQRGTLSFFWRSRYPVGPTEFPIFRVGYADHSSWDMVFLRMDYNGHGFDAFVTDASLSRTRVSVTVQPFPKPDAWTHLALAWDETRGIRFYVNGKLAAANETRAVYNAALDQFGPHSRIISPYNVQSDCNFVRGGDVDEIRIYDRMLDNVAVAALSKGDAPADRGSLPARDLADPRWRDEWWLRYGWNRAGDPPPYLADAATTVRKVEIHDAYDLKRWWWKACDGIRETTWPGVYNRSRLPGRDDYFQLPDGDCYSLSGKSITFMLPAEPWNHLEISGAAWGKMSLLFVAKEVVLFERPAGQEKTYYRLVPPIFGQEIRFDNVEQEQPIGELSAYYVSPGRDPAGITNLAYRLTSVAPTGADVTDLVKFINGRYAPDERATLVALPVNTASSAAAAMPDALGATLPHVHILIPDTWDKIDGGLDGIAIDLPAFQVKPTHGDFFPLNMRVKDPLWPLRDMFDFSFSVKPGEARTLWLDLRDRILPPGKSLYLTIAGAGADFGAASLNGASLRLVFKSRKAARAEHEIDRFTQARDCYAMLVKEHPHGAKFNLWNRFETDLKDLLRVNPEHSPGRNYAAVELGGPRPPSKQRAAPLHAPLWAFRQVELLDRVKSLVTWYIDHRQIDNGEFGGGISDDANLLNMWPGVALMGCEPEKIKESLHALLKAAFNNGLFTDGLPTIQTDDLHGNEEGIGCLNADLILEYGSPKQLERAMVTQRGVTSLTGINAAGHRHFRTSYFSGSRMATDDPWGCAKAYSYLILGPGQLLVEYNGNPTARQVITELADGLLAHRHRDTNGRYSLPGAIRFRDDKDEIATRGYFPWPLFWSAWKWTGDRKYLDPIFDGGTASLLAINANALDVLGARKDWGSRILSAERGQSTDTRAADGRGRARSPDYRSTDTAHCLWQLTGDKRYLETLYEKQIAECALLEYINTEGSLWIDRVGVPYAELQRARLGGVALVRNNEFPGHVVSWKFAAPAYDESVAILVPNATPTSFKVIACNLEPTPVRATMTGWNIDPGIWEITQGIDTNGDDNADLQLTNSMAAFERSGALEFTFAPRTTTVLTLKLKTPGRPYWQRPDLGIDRGDVQVFGREVRVRVHSLGSVPSPATTVVFRNRAGEIVATEKLHPLPAPVDLYPQTVEVALTLPDGATAAGGTVEIDPGHQIEEITRLNNVAKW